MKIGVYIDGYNTRTEQTSAGTWNWISAVSSADGTKLVAGQVGGYIFTSTDSGVKWVQLTGAGTR
ncbi:hypothetical protein [Arthrobacter wenxiniae]|uniref:Uncharacterized protein n=1 Tax=Arthrobacter wenxiniae TaxID=2713570 RepID=A0A7Y7IJK9_9MICC|nr:hypothetical protein [Arthrobacter wenxiniae]NVM96076.1 hypothetical protein [Arthrobacter wenxiniae]